MSQLSSCDDDRLQLAARAQFSLAQGRKLVKEQDYPAALECYLFAFDNGHAVNGWGGVRLSYIPAEIAELGKKYPPAAFALEERRRSREKLIREGATEFDILQEWMSLNSYLGKSDQELIIMNELEQNGILEDSVRDQIIDSNFEKILKEQKYELLSSVFDRLGGQFLHQIFHLETAELFPNKRGGDSRFLSYTQMKIKTDGLKVYELAVALRKEFQAEEIAKRVLVYSSDAVTFNGLVHAAHRAGDKATAKKLIKQAKLVLSKDEQNKLAKL